MAAALSGPWQILGWILVIIAAFVLIRMILVSFGAVAMMREPMTIVSDTPTSPPFGMDLGAYEQLSSNSIGYVDRRR